MDWKQNHPFHTDFKIGLTAQEVRQRQEKGLCNTTQEKITKSTGQILKENICTLFNLFNVLIAIALALVGAWTNMVFILVIALNTCIGIVQELHAKRLVEKLSLLSVPTANVVRDGKQQALPVDELVLDDLLVLEAGSQICADAVLLDGEIEANESLLTGESDPINKQPGDHVLSGSFVVSGKCRAQIEHVGADNYATHLSQEVKKLRQVNSELLRSMKRVTRFTGFLIVPLGILLFLEAFFLRSGALNTSVVSTAAGLLGMLPKGLVLLISISLAVGVGRLAKQKILVQDPYSLEMLAHVDTLCLDKTGTITEGNMLVESVVPLGAEPPVPFSELMGSFLRNSDDNNATFQALAGYFTGNGDFMPVKKVPFSSQRKWSAMTFDKLGTLVLGAPERLTSRPLPPEIEQAMRGGTRVLLAGWTTEPVDAKAPLPFCTPLRAILLSDSIRKNATETLAYFRKEGVDIKVISGDNPASVSAIAQRAGLHHAESYIDMSTVKSDDEIAAAAREYTVFGRVSPNQKKQLVQALQSQGHTVAMTGDGVNDILALREADCSIAIAEGSDAARQVSQLVLLNSDFSTLPNALGEGRRVVNNITRVAGVFFVKTIYSIILSILCVILNFPFPFLPIQITLIDLVIEGYPSFFISFEPDSRRVHGTFLRSVLRRASPNALATTAVVMGMLLIGPHLGLATAQIQALGYLLVGSIGIEAVFKACFPFNKLRTFLFVTTLIGYFVAVFLFHSILQLSLPTVNELPIFLVFAVVGILLERLFAQIMNRAFREKPSMRREKLR